MALHTVGPESPVEDEVVIGNSYLPWLIPVYAIAPILVAIFADTKWVVAVGFALALPNLHEIGGRLLEVCIRARRTNKLLDG